MSDMTDHALQEWQQFKSSKTVKLVLAFILTSTEEYIRCRISGDDSIPLRAWLASLFASVIVLTMRHTFAGIEAKVDATTKKIEGPTTATTAPDPNLPSSPP